MSLEEKIHLSESIRKLTNDALSTVVDYLKQMCKKCLIEVEKDKLRISIDSIDRTTFIHVQDLIQSLKVKKKIYKICKFSMFTRVKRRRR